MSMFCNQCEQTAHGTGCEKIGVCGKSPEVSALQDLLVNAVRGLAVVAVDAEARGLDTAVEGAFTADALFTTLTNVDFDAASVAGKVDEAVVASRGPEGPRPCCRRGRDVRRRVRELHPGRFGRGQDRPGRRVRLAVGHLRATLDVQSLQETTLYGMKGVGAYEHHARQLGVTDTAIYSYLFKALAAMADQRPRARRLGRASRWSAAPPTCARWRSSTRPTPAPTATPPPRP